MFSLFFWELKFNVKEKLLLKPKNHTKCRNKWTALCISDMRCDLCVLFFVVGVLSFNYLSFALAYYCILPCCIYCRLSLVFLFSFSVNYMTCLFYYCINLVVLTVRFFL